MTSVIEAANVHYAAATGVISSSWLLLVLPFFGSAALLLSGRRMGRFGPLLGCATVGASFVLGVVYFLTLLRAGSPQETVNVFSWMPVAGLQVNLALLYDPLSAVFVLLITGVGFLIHVYSVGYMEHDPARQRFFGYMNLFIGAMLLLVLGNNYVALYAGWEGVGLASYLLIGFWYDRPSAQTAARKAFLMNRVGDVGLVIAIFLMFSTTGSVSFQQIFNHIGGAGKGTLLAVTLLLLLGACGKSGQFPLQTWLPDAMEGPTPVSALIHAATMVTAGVYLIARSGPIYNLSQDGRTAVTIVGAVTLMLGCIIGCAYDDIKKVLAYSTVSQIGYMFLAVGLGPAGYAIGILHLLTHGFFKATMFLSAGSVMHGMNDEVDMRRYGGLWRVMPVTFVTFLLGYLAIIGFPGLSGFFSKDKIIEAAFDKGGISGFTLGAVALAGAGLTAFYMTRLMLMTFFGERRWAADAHPHESPTVMTVPMSMLAIGSALAGGLLIIGGGLQDWLIPSVGRSAEVGVHSISGWVISVLAIVVMAFGMVTAWLFFGRRPVPATPPVAVSPVTVAARNNLYADAFNEAVFMRPGQWLTRALVYLDNRGVDGLINGLAAFVGGGSGRLRRVQTGFVRSYALTMLGGSLIVVVALLAVRLA